MIDDYLKSSNYTQSNADPCICIYYVDNTIICSNDVSMLKDEKKRLSNRYLMTILKRFGMTDCKPVSTPIEPGTKFTKIPDGEEVIDETLYQAAVSSLNYTAIATSPDLSVAVKNTGLVLKEFSGTFKVH